MEEKRNESKVCYFEPDKVENEILKFLRLKYFIKPYVKEVYLSGDLLDRDFGFFRKAEKTQDGKMKQGSDIILIILADEKFATPSEWKKEGEEIFEKFDFGKIRGVKCIKDNVHQVYAYVFRPSLKENVVANKKKLTGDVYDMPNKRLALEFWLRKHKNKLWYKKK
jgi:hypothetical protein